MKVDFLGAFVAPFQMWGYRSSHLPNVFVNCAWQPRSNALLGEEVALKLIKLQETWGGSEYEFYREIFVLSCSIKWTGTCMFLVELR